MSQHLILSIGSDRTLLGLRDDVLRIAGYKVREYIPSEFSSPPDDDFAIAILCHSIPDAEKQRIIRSIRSRKPGVPILIVRASEGRIENVDATVHGLDGPEALLNCVESLLNKDPSGHY